MRLRLNIDEDSMSHALVRALRARGVNVVTALDEGMIERGDGEHLDYATGQGRALCTSNSADFFLLHSEYMSQGKQHAWLILIPQQRYSVGEQVRRLLKLIATRSAESMVTQVEFLSAWT